MLIYNNRLYILDEVFVRKELLKYYHNDFLARYFKFNKIFELINKKYY